MKGKYHSFSISMIGDLKAKDGNITKIQFKISHFLVIKYKIIIIINFIFLSHLLNQTDL